MKRNCGAQGLNPPASQIHVLYSAIAIHAVYAVLSERKGTKKQTQT